jgi:phosphoribosylformylglycinamidine cyclo-ligase
MAHVTGGGLAGNLSRILPAGCDAVVDTGAWGLPPVFGAVAAWGDMTREEMYAVFNMGIGFVVVTDPGDAGAAIAALEASGHETQVVGTVTTGTGRVRLA